VSYEGTKFDDDSSELRPSAKKIRQEGIGDWRVRPI
jgi:hypothetical protein